MLASETDKHWKVGYVSGSFDPFHIGHLRLLQRAKERSTTDIKKYIIGGTMEQSKLNGKGETAMLQPTGSLQKLRSLAKTRKAVVWGVGAITIHWFRNCEHLVNVSYLVDNDKNKQGEFFNGKQIHSPMVLQNESEPIILIIANSRRFKEIAEQAYQIMGDKLDFIFYAEILVYSYYFDKYDFLHSVENLFEKESLFMLNGINKKFLDGNPDFSDICEGNEYLVKEIAENTVKEEIAVDAGVYDGITTEMFINFFGQNLKKIYCFEPNSHNYEVSQKRLANFSKNCDLALIKAGLSDKDCEIEMGFSPHDFAGATIDPDKLKYCQLETITVKCLDSVIKETETVTFIKMDIEGAEYDALIGARKTIMRCKPKLAICLYHRPQDYICIPLLVKSMVPEYKLYIHHHGKFLLDTVLYAVADINEKEEA